MPRMRGCRPGLSISQMVLVSQEDWRCGALPAWSGLFYRLVAGNYHHRRRSACLGILPSFRSKRVAVDASNGYDSPGIQSLTETNRRTMQHTPLVSVIVIFFNAV